MKFSLYNKKNQLDEMQEQTMLSIEARGFWLLWAGLLLAILVQLILGTPISQWVGEFVVFMAGCIYTMIECIRNGLWDRHICANTTTNAVKPDNINSSAPAARLIRICSATKFESEADEAPSVLSGY